MQDTDHYDLSDDADYAASIQQGSKSVMMRGDTSKRSSSSEPDGSEVVYLKDNVTIHPSPYSSDRISGRFKLIKQGSSLFMTWIPYKAQNSDAKLSEKDRNLYTIRAVPFTEVRSIRRHTPTFGWQYIIIVLSSGLAFPTLYFYNGGVKEFLATVRQHVFLVRSVEDANVFIVNDFENPLQRTLSSLEIPRAVPVASGTPTIVTFDKSPSYGNHERDDVSTHNGSSGSSPSIGRHRHRRKSQDPARDLSIHVLEKFSLVTKFAREASSQLFREGQSNGFDAIGIERKSNSLSSIDVPPKPSIAADKKSDSLSSIDVPQKPSTGADKIPIESPVPKDPVEKILSRKHDPDEEAVTNVGSFELIEFKEFDKITLVWGQPRQPPLGSDEWATFLDSEGRVMDSKALRKRVFYGGVEHNLRREVWPFLLGYYAYDSTYAEREFLKSEKKMEYMTIKQQWQSISFEQAKRFTKFRERRGLIEKDVVRTDRSVPFYEGDDNPNVDILRDILLTYSFYNFDLGYCQGMSDLLSPIFFILEDESEAFWCFVALMDRLGPNFNRDQNGMHSQLFALSKLVELLDNPLHNYFKQNDCLNYFFCFRWVLIQFKREFEYEKTMQLWEVLWTHYLSEHLHLYVCVAILKRYRGKITGEQMDFDTLLKFINELSGHINLDEVLREAEALCVCAGENGAACIPPGTPPSLPIDNENSLLYAQQDEVL